MRIPNNVSHNPATKVGRDRCVVDYSMPGSAKRFHRKVTLPPTQSDRKHSSEEEEVRTHLTGRYKLQRSQRSLHVRNVRLEVVERVGNVGLEL